MQTTCWYAKGTDIDAHDAEEGGSDGGAFKSGELGLEGWRRWRQRDKVAGKKRHQVRHMGGQRRGGECCGKTKSRKDTRKQRHRRTESERQGAQAARKQTRIGMEVKPQRREMQGSRDSNRDLLGRKWYQRYGRIWGEIWG